MAMEINNVYGSYANSYAQSTNRTEKKSSKTETAKANDENSTETVSQSSKDYLNNLRQKYSDVNITVVDFKSEKQELNYMLGCSGGNNLAISQSVIDRMAKDPAVAAKYEKIIAEIPGLEEQTKAEVEATGGKYIASGVCVDKDGKVTYWIVGSKSGEGPGTKEKMQKMLEEKRVEKKNSKNLKQLKRKSWKNRNVWKKSVLKSEQMIRNEWNLCLLKVVAQKSYLLIFKLEIRLLLIVLVNCNG